jgi:hypothetical protein
MPKQAGDRYLFEWDRYAFEVAPRTGARITAFRVDGINILAEPSDDAYSFGSTFWPSPQNWNWPPPKPIDVEPYRARVDGASLIAESGAAESPTLSVDKKFTVLPDRHAMRIDYSMKNEGQKPIEVAPWENTRVRPHGLTFYPAGKKSYPKSELRLETHAGISWFLHDPAKFKQGAKSYADGAEGWLAHVENDVILIKTFPDVPEGAQAPEEGEVEIYVDGKGRFVEVEQQGSYQRLAPGAEAAWPVIWFLRRLPSSIAAKPGNPALVEFVRQTIASR